MRAELGITSNIQRFRTAAFFALALVFPLCGRLSGRVKALEEEPVDAGRGTYTWNLC